MRSSIEAPGRFWIPQSGFSGILFLMPSRQFLKCSFVFRPSSGSGRLAPPWVGRRSRTLVSMMSATPFVPTASVRMIAPGKSETSIEPWVQCITSQPVCWRIAVRIVSLDRASQWSMGSKLMSIAFRWCRGGVTRPEGEGEPTLTPPVEGFILQMLGWRECVRGIYWLCTPEDLERNEMKAEEPLPSSYWTGRTDMSCLRDAIGQTLRYGNAHHHPRLMFTDLFALLFGVRPLRFPRPSP